MRMKIVSVIGKCTLSGRLSRKSMKEKFLCKYVCKKGSKSYCDLLPFFNFENYWGSYNIIS